MQYELIYKNKESYYEFNSSSNTPNTILIIISNRRDQFTGNPATSQSTRKSKFILRFALQSSRRSKFILRLNSTFLHQIKFNLKMTASDSDLHKSRIWIHNYITFDFEFRLV